MAARFEVYNDARGEFRWRLVAANGQIIAVDGGGYTSKSGVLNAIASVRINAPIAIIEDINN